MFARASEFLAWSIMGLRIVPFGYSVHAVATSVLVLCCDCLKCVYYTLFFFLKVKLYIFYTLMVFFLFLCVFICSVFVNTVVLFVFYFFEFANRNTGTRKKFKNIGN